MLYIDIDGHHGSQLHPRRSCPWCQHSHRSYRKQMCGTGALKISRAVSWAWASTNPPPMVPKISPLPRMIILSAVRGAEPLRVRIVNGQIPPAARKLQSFSMNFFKAELSFFRLFDKSFGGCGYRQWPDGQRSWSQDRPPAATAARKAGIVGKIRRHFHGSAVRPPDEFRW